jgi:hypothetical protein
MKWTGLKGPSMVNSQGKAMEACCYNAPSSSNEWIEQK